MTKNESPTVGLATTEDVAEFLAEHVSERSLAEATEVMENMRGGEGHFFDIEFPDGRCYSVSVMQIEVG